MATQLGLYQGALRLLKHRRIASTSDAVPERYLLDDVYAGAKAFLLEQAQWSFASRSTSVSGSASSNRGFSYRFTKPSDFVRLISISASSSYYPPFENFAEDNTYWFSNETTLYIAYVSDDASYGGDLTKWPETYAKVVEAYLAMEVGPHLTKDDAILARVASDYQAALQLSIAKDAINRTVRVLSSATESIYKGVLRLVGQRLLSNFDDRIIGRRIYDPNGEAGSKNNPGQAPSLPAYDAEMETILRRLIDECYDDGIEYMLGQGLWNFGSRAVAIDAEADGPAFGYTYSFEKPDDYIRLVKISDNGTLWPTLTNDAGEAYLEEGNYFHADVDPLYIQYVSDGVAYGRDTSLWPMAFRKAVEAYLALEIAPHAPKMSARGLEGLRNHYAVMLKDARNKDCVNQASIRPPPGRLARSRFGNGTRGQRREN